MLSFGDRGRLLVHLSQNWSSLYPNATKSVTHHRSTRINEMLTHEERASRDRLFRAAFILEVVAAALVIYGLFSGQSHTKLAIDAAQMHMPSTSRMIQ